MTDHLTKLLEQIERLRRTPCPTMRFGMEPADVLAATRAECDEVEAEDPGSAVARREAAGVISVAVHLLLVHGGGPTDIEEEIVRLRTRLDHVATGRSWETAKRLERGEAAVRSPVREE